MSAILRQKYSFVNLFAVIGTTYGGGDGVSTFNVPDLRDKAIMGADTSNPNNVNSGNVNHGKRLGMNYIIKY